VLPEPQTPTGETTLPDEMPPEMALEMTPEMALERTLEMEPAALPAAAPTAPRRRRVVPRLLLVAVVLGLLGHHEIRWPEWTKRLLTTWSGPSAVIGR
jgi:hypothetical protein